MSIPTQTATVPFPRLRAEREIDRQIREQVQYAWKRVLVCCVTECATLQILDLNISVLFDYADKDYSGRVEVRQCLQIKAIHATLHAPATPLQVAELVTFLTMIDVPSARLRLQRCLPELKQHENGIDPATFKFFMMKCCTTDTCKTNHVDEAAIAISTLLRNIRQIERKKRARKRAATISPPEGTTRARLQSRSKITRIPVTALQFIERNKARKRTVPEENATLAESSLSLTGASALFEYAEDVGDTCWKKFTRHVFLVDEMHKPVLLIIAWILLGTMAYIFVQGWTVGQSFYFMIQASCVRSNTITFTDCCWPCGICFRPGLASASVLFRRTSSSAKPSRNAWCVVVCRIDASRLFLMRVIDQNVTHNNSWQWLSHLRENETFPLR